MKKLLHTLILIICIIVFCFSAWKLYGIWEEYHAGDEIYESVKNQVSTPGTKDDSNSESREPEDTSGYSIPSSLVDLAALKEINEDTIGWIQIPDTEIDYPILQAEDNERYLRRTITGESNKAGCIFVDYQIKAPFNEANTLIYGHNLLNGKMFSNLTKYEEKSWLESHPVIFIQTEDGVSAYEIYSCYRTQDDSQTYTLGFQTETQEYLDYLNYSLKEALYSTDINPTYSDQILTLSTCTNEEDTERFIVHARKIIPE